MKNRKPNEGRMKLVDRVVEPINLLRALFSIIQRLFVKDSNGGMTTTQNP